MNFRADRAKQVSLAPFNGAGWQTMILASHQARRL